MSSDASMTIAFLQTYQPDDWIALFLKSYASGRLGQRVLPVRLATTGRIQAWLHRENESGMNLYVSLNAVAPQQTSRRRAAIRTVRHVFVDVDHRGEHVLEAISRRHDLPRPSYVLHTSPQRVHVLWRVTRFLPDTSEALQRHLARELHADTAATSCAQLTRLAGFLYLKSPVAWPCRMILTCKGLLYAAVTHTTVIEARRRSPRSSSFSPGASWFCLAVSECSGENESDGFDV